MKKYDDVLGEFGITAEWAKMPAGVQLWFRIRWRFAALTAMGADNMISDPGQHSLPHRPQPEQLSDRLYRVVATRVQR